MNLQSNEYHPYYDLYLSKCPFEDIGQGLTESKSDFTSFLKSIPDEKLEFRYALDKWTVKEVVLHVVDTERIFAYRALRFARRDFTSLAGFDQDEYVPLSKANKRSIASLIEEFETVRQSTISLFKSFEVEDLLQIGKASSTDVSVRALGYILIGHQNHHKEIIEQRYL
ncbi:DinB family protein [Paucihalobacter sp.]|uniref:DinB family protein n=1 Tax=Paucihalobacter sp. TaxID=2850405 RepID=UPI002FE3F479